MTDDLRFGVTRHAHVPQLVQSITDALVGVCPRLVDSRTIGPSERDTLSRQLAGVIGQCEALRIWLAAGAPK